MMILFLGSCVTAQEIELKNIKHSRGSIGAKPDTCKIITGLTAIQQMDTAKAMKLIDITPGLEDSTKQQLKKAITEAPEIAKGVKGIIQIAKSRDEYSNSFDWLIDLIWQIALIWGLLEAAVRKLTFIPKQFSPFYWFKKFLGKHKGFKRFTDKDGNVTTRTGTWQGDIFIPDGSEVVIQDKKPTQ